MLIVIAVTITLTTAVSAQAECPSDDAFFCSQYELAEQGYASAQYNLGGMYGIGEGVIADYHEAYIWLSIAKANGDERAAGFLDKIDFSVFLNSAEIKSARREAARRLEAIDRLLSKTKQIIPNKETLLSLSMLLCVAYVQDVLANNCSYVICTSVIVLMAVVV